MKTVRIVYIVIVLCAAVTAWCSRPLPKIDLSISAIDYFPIRWFDRGDMLTAAQECLSVAASVGGGVCDGRYWNGYVPTHETQPPR